jgi:hypothetical protein
VTNKDVPFNTEDNEQLAPGVYRPIPPNPSPVRLAWFLVGISLLVGLYTRTLETILPVIYWIALGLLIVVALAMSLSYWLEGRIAIHLKDDRIEYQSPLRNVVLSWQEIDELWCARVRGGWRYMVTGQVAAFRFQSLLVIRASSGREVRSGFVEGQGLAQSIYRNAELDETDRQEDIWIYRRSA